MTRAVQTVTAGQPVRRRTPATQRGLTVSVAVIGTGSAGLKHLRALKQLSGVHPIAVPKRSTRVRELVREGQRAVKNLSEAARAGATLGIIATDTVEHVADGVEALAHGWDLLVEKPLSIDGVEAQRLVAQARQAGRQLFVGCTMRFSESLGTFRDQLPRIGTIHTVRVECQSYLPDWRPGRPHQQTYAARAGEGGALRDLIHELDYATWIFGWPSAVYARLKNLGRLGIAEEEVAELTWEAGHGTIISMTLDYLSRPARRVMRASGAHGTVEWDALQGTVTVSVVGDAPVRMTSSQTREQTFLAQARAFIEACRGGARDPRLASGEEGVRVLTLCDAARRSDVSRREEPVETR